MNVTDFLDSFLTEPRREDTTGRTPKEAYDLTDEHEQPCDCLPCKATAAAEAVRELTRKRHAEHLSRQRGTPGLRPDRHAAVPPSQTNRR